jgi:ADP-heptose:LPS heptosyltransferase
MIKVRGNPSLHFLDRYVGIPAIALAGILRRKRGLPTDIRKIGLLKGGAIGDTVLLSAVIADLRDAFPSAELILFAGETNYEMACLLDEVDRVIKAPAGNVVKGIDAMRSTHVDVLIDFGQWTRLESLFTILSKSAFTIGFRTNKQHRHHGFDLAVEHSCERHEIENYRALVRPLGVKTSHLPSLTARPESSSVAPVYVVFHLWSGGRRRELKQWPSDRWRRLIGEFAELGFNVALTGSASDGPLNDYLIGGLPESLHPRTVNVAGASLAETLGVLSGARLVVSVDTGIMHLASALGTRLVALHGPTSSKRWGPLNPRSIALDTPLPGGGFISLGWEEISSPPACMEAISYDSVRNACDSLLREVGASSASANTEEGAEAFRSAAP